VALKLSDDEVGAGLNSAHQRAVAEGVQVLGLHHQRKAGADNKKPMTLDTVYGSRWITAGCGSVIMLWGEPGDPVVELRHLKQPVEPIGPFKVLHDHDHGTSSIFERVDILELVAARPGVTAADVAIHLFDKPQPTPSDREKARRLLNRKVDAGLLHRKDGIKGGRGGGMPDRYFPIARI
jgi:hypothetical protein